VFIAGLLLTWGWFETNADEEKHGFELPTAGELNFELLVPKSNVSKALLPLRSLLLAIGEFNGLKLLTEDGG